MSISLFPDPNTSFQLATKQDIPAILTLIEKVRTNLNEAQQHFLKDKSAEDIAAYIDAQFPTVLAFKHGQLAGVAISTPQDPANNMGATNLHGMFNKGHYMCIGTVAVDPDFRGQGIGPQVIDKAFAESVNYIENQENSKLVGVLAKVSTANSGSQKAFLTNGFNQSPQNFTDADGGYEFSIFSKMVAQPEISGEYIGGERERRVADIRAFGKPTMHHG